ncbi:MAG: SPOR domain-containing protein [Candidatus Krumholzibacteria bacterium]|nr:SPOR domain-containing protein [Candidatus Krumholzibacteria bacterium]
MRSKIRHFYPLTAAAAFVIFICLLAGCAGTVKSTGTPVEQQETVPPPPLTDTKQDAEPVKPEAEEPYDLESEMPEDDSVRESDAAEESIEPVKADTFSVEETVEPPAPVAGYKLGYRVQLAAFAESAGARDLKKKVVAAAGIAVYIDYEDGLYKVRAGDFATRAEASEARTKLAADYPDCWIVRTTVTKAK